MTPFEHLFGGKVFLILEIDRNVQFSCTYKENI